MFKKKEALLYIIIGFLLGVCAVTVFSQRSGYAAGPAGAGSICCSADGRYVFALTSTDKIIQSSDHGLVFKMSKTIP